MYNIIFLPTITILYCFCYCSPNGTDFPILFQYTISHETVTFHPNAEILYLGDFNVHHTECLGSSHTDTVGKESKSFSILNDLEQLIREPIHISDRLKQFLNT
ncbi:UNVERIFIED_CONTAM: hypothetical protein RMT77_007079 [Armadillidium vulgare]